MNTLYHIIFYGCLGWVVEITYTGFHSAIIERNAKATGTTYLWMLPIYGLTALGFEGLRYVMVLGSLPLITRVLAYLIIIYAVEYTAGWLLEKTIGVCPWHYPNGKWTIHNKIRLDYAPCWLMLCFAVEPCQHLLEKMFCS